MRAVRGDAIPTPAIQQSGEVVSDATTGLMWLTASADTNNTGTVDESDMLNWQQAVAYCENLNFATYDDWRMPNINEFRFSSTTGSLWPYTKDRTWSSTTDKNYLTAAWYFHPERSSVSGDFNKTSENYVTCVRGGYEGK